MTPEEQVTDTLVSLGERERLHEWPDWRLRETRAMISGARIAMIASQDYTSEDMLTRMQPLHEVLCLIDAELSRRCWDVYDARQRRVEDNRYV